MFESEINNRLFKFATCDNKSNSEQQEVNVKSLISEDGRLLGMDSAFTFSFNKVQDACSVYADEIDYEEDDAYAKKVQIDARKLNEIFQHNGIYDYDWKVREGNNRLISEKICREYKLKIEKEFFIGNDDSGSQYYILKKSTSNNSQYDRRYLLAWDFYNKSIIIGQHLCFLSHIRADARNQWMIEIDANLQKILGLPYMVDRRRALEQIASTIYGIGNITIDKTLAYIELLVPDYKSGGEI